MRPRWRRCWIPVRFSWQPYLVRYHPHGARQGCLTETQLVANAQNVFQPQQIVLAHANLPSITHCLAQLSDIINSHGLQTVTLADVFS